MSFLLCIAILVTNYIVLLFSKKLNILSIVVQLIVAMILAPMVNIYFATDIHQWIQSSLIKTTYNFSFVLLIAYILHDNIDCSYKISDLKLAVPSFFVPFFSGVVFSCFWCGAFIFKLAVVFGVIFSITAVPVLYMYLYSMRYSAENKKFFIQSAVMIDVFSWLISSFTMDFNPIILVLSALSVILALIVNIIKPCLSGIVFLILLAVTSYFKTNVLLVGVLFVLVSSFFKNPINLVFSEQQMDNINKYVLIPLILFIGLLRIDWHQINIDINIKTILVVLLPIVTKILGNYLGLLWLKKDDIWQSSILLNTRGLTEIVFLNLALEFQLIDNKIYVLFLTMSLLSTVFPAIFFKSLKNKY